MASNKEKEKAEDIYEFPLIETLRETDKAVLVRIECDSTTLWLPKSKVDYVGTKKEPAIEIPQWLAVQRGLIDSEEEK